MMRLKTTSLGVFATWRFESIQICCRSCLTAEWMDFEILLDQQAYDVPVATQTRLNFDVILPLRGRRGPRSPH
jgi:hypothetical protein